MDFFGQEPPKMNFEGQKTIKTRCGTFCSMILIFNISIVFLIHLVSMFITDKYLDLTEYTREEQDRGHSDYELTNYLIAF